MTDDEISEILLPLMPLKDPYVFARAIAAAEREACAMVCDEVAKNWNYFDDVTASEIKLRIMARSNLNSPTDYVG